MSVEARPDIDAWSVSVTSDPDTESAEYPSDEPPPVA
jgi:hypothetical protein